MSSFSPVSSGLQGTSSRVTHTHTHTHAQRNCPAVESTEQDLRAQGRQEPKPERPRWKGPDDPPGHPTRPRHLGFPREDAGRQAEWFGRGRQALWSLAPQVHTLIRLKARGNLGKLCDLPPSVSSPVPGRMMMPMGQGSDDYTGRCAQGTAHGPWHGAGAQYR